MIDEALLGQLLTIEAPAGDEAPLADFLEARLSTAGRFTFTRIGNTLIVARGKPRVAVFAHIDSVGFTLGHAKRLLRIGYPMPAHKTPIRTRTPEGVLRGKLMVRANDDEHWVLSGEGPLGSAWVYDTAPNLSGEVLQAAYLDNRFGVYNALDALMNNDDVCVAFTACEEAGSRGAYDAARWLYENTPIRQALISDITWAAGPVSPGKGPALSLRDAFIPRREYFEKIRGLAERSGVPFQIEIIDVGASDGGALEKSGLGFDWLFVGAAENGYHTAYETLQRVDAENMLRLYRYLVSELSR